MPSRQSDRPVRGNSQPLEDIMFRAAIVLAVIVTAYNGFVAWASSSVPAAFEQTVKARMAAIDRIGQE